MTPGRQPVERPFLSIVIPAFNEEHRITSTLDQVTAYLRLQIYTAEVLVVDDGSTDGTARLVQAYESSGYPVRLASLEHQGKGGAVKAGMLMAKGEYRFLCDADLAMPIEELAAFLPPRLEGVDVAVGSREAKGARRYNEPLHRHLMGRLFNGLIRATAVRGVSDTQCGFKCFRGDIVDEVFGQQRLRGFGFDVEVLFIAQRRGLRIQEIPITWYHQPDSKVRPLRDTVSMAREVAQVRWNYLRRRYRLEQTAEPAAQTETAKEPKP